LQTGDAKYLEPLRLEHQLAEEYGYVAELRGRERLGQAPWLTHGPDTRDGFDVLMQRWTPPRRENTVRSGPAMRSRVTPDTEERLLEAYLYMDYS
jgi:hypothetical protein